MPPDFSPGVTVDIDAPVTGRSGSGAAAPGTCGCPSPARVLPSGCSKEVPGGVDPFELVLAPVGELQP
jgi:hypothetical protein